MYICKTYSLPFRIVRECWRWRWIQPLLRLDANHRGDQAKKCISFFTSRRITFLKQEEDNLENIERDYSEVQLYLCTCKVIVSNQ